MSERYDVAIVGGGPGGSTAASFLAMRGVSVAVFEREKFPRFHIGESLLPFNMGVFERLGIVDRLAAEFIEKWGAEFVSSDGRVNQVFHFADGLISGRPMCYQVLRSRFDQLLLDVATERGARVFQGQTVLEAKASSREGTELRIRDEEGSERTVRARFLLDASGRDGLFPGRFRRQKMDAKLRKAAVFAHFEGIPRRPGRDGGNIVLVLLRDAWFWFIPLAGKTTSVGLVMDGKTYRTQGMRPQELFESAVAACPAAADLLREARRLSPVRSTSDWSYHCRRVSGDGFILVGDSAGFVDPIFSSGVYLAMTSGELAAQAAAAALASGDFSTRAFAPYARQVTRNVHQYRRLARRFYRPGFTEVCLSPARRLRLTPAVISLLAGCLDGGWPLAWRLALFYTVVRLQPLFPLAPRRGLQHVFDPAAASRRSGAAAAGAM
jgi:flavin-dependent dehydrogenase